MKITYSPEGQPVQVWDFDPRKLMVVELEAIEKFTGLGFAEWAEALEKSSPTALRSLVWVLSKRQNPTLKYADVDFALGDLDFEADEDEKPADDEDGASVLPKD